MKITKFDFSHSKAYASEENADKAVAKAVAAGKVPEDARYFIVRRPSDARFTPVFVTQDINLGASIADFGWSSLSYGSEGMYSHGRRPRLIDW